MSLEMIEIITVTSYWAWWCHRSPVSQLFVQAQMKENIKARRHWPLWGNPLVTGGFPSQRASKVENVFIWWCHHDINHWNISNYHHISQQTMSKRYLCSSYTGTWWGHIYEKKCLRSWDVIELRLTFIITLHRYHIAFIKELSLVVASMYCGWTLLHLCSTYIYIHIYSICCWRGGGFNDICKILLLQISISNANHKTNRKDIWLYMK